MKRARLRVAAAAALLLPALAAAGPGAPAAKAEGTAPLTWAEEGDIGCNWAIRGPDGKTRRASVGTGDDDPVLTIDDPAFLPFPEYGKVPVTMRFDGDPGRTASVSAWTGIVIDGERSIGMFLDASARQAMGGARRVEVIHEGKVLLDLPLARTPTLAQLEACSFPPGRKGDQE